MNLDEMFDFLTNDLGINEEVISCMIETNGFNQKTAEDILYWATGYRDFNQVIDDEYI